MPIISFICETCGPFEQYRSIHSTDCPPCPTCGSGSQRHWITAAPSHAPAPVIVYRAPDGSYRYPGDGSGLYAQKCERDGFTRVELRGWADVRRFEKDANRQERSKIEAKIEREQAVTEHAERQRRSDLFQKMSGMSTFGRDLARAAVEMNNRKPGPRTYDSGLHVSAYSDDRSNRDDSRDDRGRRRRD